LAFFADSAAAWRMLATSEAEDRNASSDEAQRNRRNATCGNANEFEPLFHENQPHDRLYQRPFRIGADTIKFVMRRQMITCL
jgi:hypothetical protein